MSASPTSPIGPFTTPLLIAGVSLAIAACSGPGFDRPVPFARRPAAICESAQGEGTAFGGALARSHALQSARHQVAEVKGFLAVIGIRRTRVFPPRVACEPYALLPGNSGMYRCVAGIRVCSR